MCFELLDGLLIVNAYSDFTGLNKRRDLNVSRLISRRARQKCSSKFTGIRDQCPSIRSALETYRRVPGYRLTRTEVCRASVDGVFDALDRGEQYTFNRLLFAF